MSDLEKTVELLEKVPLFAGLKKRQLTTLARISSNASAIRAKSSSPRGDGYGFFIITSGAAEAVLERPDGTKVVVNTFKSPTSLARWPCWTAARAPPRWWRPKNVIA
jgi:hypothetical protein